jgi:hypothetical protein
LALDLSPLPFYYAPKHKSKKGPGSEMIVLSEVNASIYAKGTTPALDPVELSVEEEAQGFARRLKTLQGGERQFKRQQGACRTPYTSQESGTGLQRLGVSHRSFA